MSSFHTKTKHNVLNLLDGGLTRVVVAVDVGLTVGKQLYLQINNVFGALDL